MGGADRKGRLVGYRRGEWQAALRNVQLAQRWGSANTLYLRRVRPVKHEVAQGVAGDQKTVETQEGD